MRQFRRNPTPTTPATTRQVHRMNGTMSDIRSALASAAKTYEPSRRVRFKAVAPFEDEIRELRNRGAAFVIIAGILKKHEVKSSHETVRRFYREVIEGKPRRRKRRRNSRTRAQPAKPPRIPSSNGNTPRPATAKAERGPRIARIEEL
ncbi:MAG: hypothetical protein ABSE59_11885 [Opitutaceae bacterium]|jgi:hypothetical protein